MGGVLIYAACLITKHILKGLDMYIYADNGLNIAATLTEHTKESDNKKFFIANFTTKVKWALFPNEYYQSDFETTSKGENKYYKHIAEIPKYSVCKNGEKISVALPRLDTNDEKFLFIPKGRTIRPELTGTPREKFKYALTKTYYKFNVTDEWEIINDTQIYF